jgi:hypothetical protein
LLEGLPPVIVATFSACEVINAAFGTWLSMHLAATIVEGFVIRSMLAGTVT